MSWSSTWQKLKGEIRETFGELTDDDLEKAAGSRDKLIGRLQERHGYTLKQAEERVDEVISATSA